MTLVDPIGDMLTRIRNGQMRSLNKIDIPFSNFRLKILGFLKKRGYIINFVILILIKKIKAKSLSMLILNIMRVSRL